MRAKSNWVGTLNEQTRWYDRSDFTRWFTELVGRPLNLTDGTIEAFEETLGYMRCQVAKLHFGEPVDLFWLDMQLQTITMGLLHHQGAQEGESSKLPRFRARVRGMQDIDLLRAFKETLLLQFGEYIGETLEVKPKEKVERCAGLQEAATAPKVAFVAHYPQELEERWKVELAATVSPADQTDLVRCAQLVFVTGAQKSRFCSDLCRFSHGRVDKRLPEPELIAVKPSRYRHHTTV